MKGLSLLESALRFAEVSLLGKRRLLGVGWAITYQCNAQCPFCSQNRGPDGVPTDQALDIVDQLAALGCGRVHLTGGEPLLRADLPRLLARMGARGMRRTINTNGSLLTARRDVVEQCDAFVISVDGPRVVHDGYRGSGSFDRLIQGAQLLASLGKRFVFCVTLLRGNLDQLPFFLQLARRFETRVLFQPGLAHVLGGESPNPERPEPARFRALMRELLAHGDMRRHVWNSKPALEILARYPEPHALPCSAGRVTCRLEPDGSLYPCAQIVEDPRCVDPPNVLELGVAEAFRRLPGIDRCAARCSCAHTLEKGLILSWDPAALWNIHSRDYVGLPWR